MYESTNFQRYLDFQKADAQNEWREELENLDMSGDFTVADAEGFFNSIRKKEIREWAINLEMSTRHDALKKIIDSV